MCVHRMHWTGNPFVDAGLAALAAVLRVSSLEDIEPEDLEKASAKLQSVLLSDQALGIGVERAFVSGPLSKLFPNSEIVNPAPFLVEVGGKRRDVRALLSTNPVIPEWQEVLCKAKERLRESLKLDLHRAQICLTQEGKAICMFCGRFTPEESTTFIRKDKMPLLGGIVNFYPAFSWGVQICGLCAFALRFLPFSVMRAGGRLWILHTHSLPVAARIAEQYGWHHCNAAIAQNKALDFYGSWETVGEDSTVAYVLCELLDTFPHELSTVYREPLPTTAYVFSNDNQGGYIRAVQIPNDFLVFLAKLQVHSFTAFRRFWRELLFIPENLPKQEWKERASFVQEVAHRMMQKEDLIKRCLDNETWKLAGGWFGHRLYLQEVRKMSVEKLSILERLGMMLAETGDSKKRINELKTAHYRDLYGIFLNYVREGFLKSEEFYALFPPNDDTSCSEARDIVLAVVYEWQRCREKGETFQPLGNIPVLTSDTTVQRVQDIGTRLLSQLSNPSKWIGQLRTAKTAEGVRRVYLLAVQQGALSFADFVFLVPFDNQHRLWLLRDYLMAFLFDRARDVLPQEEEV